MLLLAIDSATRHASVALLRCGPAGAVTVADRCREMGSSHAVHLLELVERTLAEAGAAKTEIDAFAVVRGPGSFTGLRIALGTARGLALASGRPCVGVGTLEAMAEAAGPCPAERVALLGAGRGELYGARYDAAGSPPGEIEAPWLRPAESAWDEAGAYFLWGERARPSEPLPSSAGREAPASLAAAAGRIAWLRGIPERGTRSERLLAPLYIRPSDAELQRRRTD